MLCSCTHMRTVGVKGLTSMEGQQTILHCKSACEAMESELLVFGKQCRPSICLPVRLNSETLLCIMTKRLNVSSKFIHRHFQNHSTLWNSDGDLTRRIEIDQISWSHSSFLLHVKLSYRIVSYQTEDLASDGLLDRAMLTTGGDSTRFKAQLWCCRGQWSPSFITTAITKHRPPDEISNWLIFATEYAFETFSTKKHSSPKSTAYRRTCMRERCDPFSFVIAGVLVITKGCRQGVDKHWLWRHMEYIEISMIWAKSVRVSSTFWMAWQ